MRHRSRPTHPWRFGLVVAATFLATLALPAPIAFGTDPSPQSSVNIRLVHSSETSAYVRAVADRFNQQRQTLPDGAVVSISTASLDDLTAVNRITSGEIPTQLWLAPSMPWVTFAQSSSPKSPVSLVDCTSLFGSALGIAYRFTDNFAIERVDGTTELDQLTKATTHSHDRAPALVMGAPQTTASGMATLLMMTARASSVKVPGIKPTSVTDNLASLATTQTKVRNYFLSDYATIDWLEHRGGGQPIVVFTLQQAYRLYKARNPLALIEWSTLTHPAYRLDFPLCSVESKSTTPVEQQAVRLVRGFLTSPEARDSISGAGFDPPMSGQAEAFADTEGTTSAILQSWSKIRHKSSTIFIVDTSIKTTKPVLDSIKQQVSSFISTRVSEGDLVSLISSSTNSDVLAATSSDTSSLESAMNRMTTSGGTAIRDGLIIGFDLFAEERSQKLRRAIVAFVSSKDTSSKTAVAQLLNRGNQLVGRRNVQLYVLGIDGDPGSFGDLPGLVNTIGGTFLTTRQGDLPTTLAPILKQIE
jgi:hypothetical protein